MKEDYILFYSGRKREEELWIDFFFSSKKKLNLLWTEQEIEKAKKEIEENSKTVKQFIFWGLEQGWDRLIQELEHSIPVKIISNTQHAYLYDSYERTQFFKLLELSQKGYIKQIAFFRKDMYEFYLKKQYSVFHLLENIRIGGKTEPIENNKNKTIGFYPLDNTWEKNIYNQLSVGKWKEDFCLQYSEIEEKMKEFTRITKIKAEPKKVNKNNIREVVGENKIILSCYFTQIVHPHFFISMEQEIPCIIGNTEDFLPEELRQYLVVKAEDNPILIADKIEKTLENREKILELYYKWKAEYNKKAEENWQEFLV